MEFLKIAFVILYAEIIDGKSVNRAGQFSYSECKQTLSDVVCVKVNITKVYNEEKASLWPPGPYALPDIRGCPESNSKGWKRGVMDIQISERKHLKFKFCVKSRSHPELDKAEWVPGIYGIYKAGKTCPKGFKETHRKLNSGHVIKAVTYTGQLPTVVVNNQSDGINITFSLCERYYAEVNISDTEFGMLQTEFSIIKKDVICEQFRGTFGRNVTVDGDTGATFCVYVPYEKAVELMFFSMTTGNISGNSTIETYTWYQLDLGRTLSLVEINIKLSTALQDQNIKYGGGLMHEQFRRMFLYCFYDNVKWSFMNHEAFACQEEATSNKATLTMYMRHVDARFLTLIFNESSGIPTITSKQYITVFISGIPEGDSFHEDLGMADMTIKDPQILASSWVPNHPPSAGRPFGTGWCAEKTDMKPWILVDLEVVTVVEGLSIWPLENVPTGYDKGCTSIAMSYGKENDSLTVYNEMSFYIEFSQLERDVQEFVLINAIHARYIKLELLQCIGDGSSCLRFELRGWKISDTVELFPILIYSENVFTANVKYVEAETIISSIGYPVAGSAQEYIWILRFPEHRYIRIAFSNVFLMTSEHNSDIILVGKNISKEMNAIEIDHRYNERDFVFETGETLMYLTFVSSLVQGKIANRGFQAVLTQEVIPACMSIDPRVTSVDGRKEVCSEPNMILTSMSILNFPFVNTDESWEIHGGNHRSIQLNIMDFYVVCSNVAGEMASTFEIIEEFSEDKSFCNLYKPAEVIHSKTSDLVIRFQNNKNPRKTSIRKEGFRLQFTTINHPKEPPKDLDELRSAEQCSEELYRYQKTLSKSKSGITCQRWDSQTPHKHQYSSNRFFPGETITDAGNFCRNPDNEPFAWCYTTNAKIRWDLCDVEICKTKQCSEDLYWYQKTLGKSKSGITCQRWDSQTPHRHRFSSNNYFPDETITDAGNFCRNPDNELFAWCYTTNDKRRWEYCDVHICQTSCSKILKKCYTVISSMTTWNEARQSCLKRGENLVTVHSDLELQFVHYLLREKSYQNIKNTDSDTHYNTLVLSSCHIGLRRRQIDGKKIPLWSDSSPFTYSAWTQGNSFKNGDCTRTNFNIYVNKTWESEDCQDDHAQFFVCQSPTGNEYEDNIRVDSCERPALQNRQKANVTISERACQRWDNLDPNTNKDFRQRIPLTMNLTQLSNNCLNSSTGQLWCYPTGMGDHLLEPCLILPEKKNDAADQSTTGFLFKCDDNRKIPSIYRCDGEFHCSDFSDEMSCVNIITWHRLFKNFESIPTSTSRQFDKEQYYLCGSKEWIHILGRCDGTIDCVDASDEMHCARPSEGCSDFEFPCNDGSCIHNSKVCDFFNDCSNGEDEFCVDCDDKFHCDVEECIRHDLVCNGEKDCEDGSDEKNCDRSVIHVSTCDEWWELGYHISGQFVLDDVKVFCDFTGVSDHGGKMKISFPIDVDIESNKLNTRSLQLNNPRCLDLISKSECSLQVHTRCPFSSQASVPIHQIDVSPYCQCIVDAYNITHVRKNRQPLRITERSKKAELNFSLYESKQCGVEHEHQVATNARFYNVVSSDAFYIDDRVLKKVVPVDITTKEITCVYDYKPQPTDPMMVCEGENKMIPKSMQCVYDIDNSGVLKGCHSASHLKDCGNRSCPINTVKCPDSYCIPIRFACDGTIQCPGGEDEHDCTCLQSSSREIFILVEDTPDSADSYTAAVKLAEQFYNANSDIRLLHFKATTLEVESFIADGLEITEELFRPFEDFAFKKCHYNTYAVNFLGKVQFSSENSSKAVIMIVDSRESYIVAERIWSTAIPFSESGFMNYHVSKNNTLTLNYRKPVTTISVKEISVRRWSELFSIGFRRFPEICTVATRVPCFGGYRCLSSKQCIPIEQLCDGIAQCSGNDDEMFCDNICPEGCKCVGYTIDCRGSNIDVNDIVKMSMKTRIADFSHNPAIKNALIGGNIRFPLMVNLNLSSCLIKNIDAFAFSHLTNLKWLDIGNNKLKRLPDNLFLNLNHLVDLNLDGNSDLSEISSTSFHGLKLLRSLHITNTKLRKISSHTFSYLTLESINISYNEIEEIEDYAFSNISVEKIDFRGNDIKNFNKHIFSEVVSLQELYTPDFTFCCIRPCYLDEGDCYPKKNEFSSCEDLMRHPVLQAVLWIVGISALFGNVGSIVYRLLYDRERLKIGYGIFVTNLAAADLLMGVYILMIAVVDSLYRNRYIFEDDKWRNSNWCVTAGVLSTVSSEASVLFLCLITLDRLLVIKYPFGGVRFGPRKAYIFCLASWIIAFALAIIPVIHTSYFENKFYSRSGVCVALPLTRDKPPGWMYSVTVFVGLNFCTFILVAFGQLCIFLEIRRATRGISKTQKSRKRDLRVARNLILVATTDFLCWFPVGVMGIMALNGYPIPGDVYAWTAVFVLPLNSALNPVLYTLSAILGKQSFNPSTEEQDRTENKKDIGSAVLKYRELSQSVCIKKGVTRAGKSIHDLLREDTPMSTLSVTEISMQLAKYLCVLHESSIGVDELSETTTYIDINKKKKRHICIAVDSRISLVNDEKVMQDNIFQFGILLRRMTANCKKTKQSKQKPDCSNNAMVRDIS